MTNAEPQQSHLSDVEPYVGTREVADLIGVTPKHITNLCLAGKIPFYRMPGTQAHYRFLISEIQAWMKGEK
jgi:excisionase family DNA binding protein